MGRSWLVSFSGRGRLGVIEGIIGHGQGLDGRKVSYSGAFEFEGTRNNNFLFPLACGNDLFRAFDFEGDECDANGWWQQLQDDEDLRQAVIAPHSQLSTKDALPDPERSRAIAWRKEDTTELDPGEWMEMRSTTVDQQIVKVLVEQSLR